MKRIYDFIIFASDATILGIWGCALMMLALIALFAEWRRNRSARIDRIGWVPWTAIFMFSAIIGAGLLTLAVKGMASGGQ